MCTHATANLEADPQHLEHLEPLKRLKRLKSQNQPSNNLYLLTWY